MFRSLPSRPPGYSGPSVTLPGRRSFAREVEARIRRLKGFVTTTIGSARYGNRVYPILACTTSGAGDRRRPKILVSGGVHGDEVAGVFAALEFLETLAPPLTPWFQIAVLPCMNPSGFELETLETADGANLNRLFGTETRQPEIVAVDSWLRRLNHRFAVTFDLHEVYPDYRGEGFVESDNPRACYLYETQEDHSRRIGRLMVDALPPSFEVCRWPFVYEDTNDEGVVSYPEACRNLVYANRTTFDAYLHGHFTGHSFTLETPMVWPLEKRIQAHLLWLDTALTRLRAVHEG